MKSKIINIAVSIIFITSLNSCYDKEKAKSSFNLGMQFYELESYQEAITDFDDAIKIYPKYEQAYFQRGMAKQKNNLHRAAIKDFNKAIEINSENLNYIFAKGYSEGCLLGKSKIDLIKKEVYD